MQFSRAFDRLSIYTEAHAYRCTRKYIGRQRIGQRGRSRSQLTVAWRMAKRKQKSVQNNSETQKPKQKCVKNNGEKCGESAERIKMEQNTAEPTTDSRVADPPARLPAPQPPHSRLGPAVDGPINSDGSSDINGRATQSTPRRLEIVCGLGVVKGRWGRAVGSGECWATAAA